MSSSAQRRTHLSSRPAREGCWGTAAVRGCWVMAPRILTPGGTLYSITRLTSSVNPPSGGGRAVESDSVEPGRVARTLCGARDEPGEDERWRRRATSAGG